MPRALARGILLPNSASLLHGIGNDRLLGVFSTNFCSPGVEVWTMEAGHSV